MSYGFHGITRSMLLVGRLSRTVFGGFCMAGMEQHIFGVLEVLFFM